MTGASSSNDSTNLSSQVASSWLRRTFACGRHGAGGSNLRFMLADNTIGCHSSEMPVGTYKKGHRHYDGVCVYAVTGKGYSLLWHEDDADFTRIDWEHGCIYCPPESMFHQHFNTADHPSRQEPRDLAHGPLHRRIAYRQDGDVRRAAD